MKSAKLSKRFFESTRGRIVTYLRGSESTVNDLASHLDLTDNAVRAHLATLERDGLVKQSGLKKGSRKPHFAYELTAEGEQLFPKAYDALLNQFIRVLKQRLSPKALLEALHAVGRSLAADKKKLDARQKLEERVQTAVRTLEELGGSPRLEEKDHQLSITSRNCPLAAVVAEHPETCQMVETLLSEIVEAKVVEECDRNETPKCRFVWTAH